MCDEATSVHGGRAMCIIVSVIRSTVFTISVLLRDPYVGMTYQSALVIQLFPVCNYIFYVGGTL